ncbi:MAG: hypothetical protein HY815_16365 [Candidatus Riflebacteria bacterium]|nr:hypothetical protein [Candidatus Riflebacteria bacterium]
MLTYYRPFPDDDAAATRQRLLGTPWPAWRDMVLDDLETAHPGLDRTVRRLDVMVWAHAMVRPTVGLIWGPQRQQWLVPVRGLHLAHCDTSGLPLFEQAMYQGIRCADAAMTERGVPYATSLS